MRTYTHIDRIMRESQIVSRAIDRHEQEAKAQGRTDEVEAMHRLGVGVARLAFALTSQRTASELPKRTSRLEISPQPAAR